LALVIVITERNSFYLLIIFTGADIIVRSNIILTSDGSNVAASLQQRCDRRVSPTGNKRNDWCQGYCVPWFFSVFEGKIAIVVEYLLKWLKYYGRDFMVFRN